jgi:hypothetical protein
MWVPARRWRLVFKLTSTINTFDRDFAKLHGVTHKKPGDFGENPAGK